MSISDITHHAAPRPAEDEACTQPWAQSPANGVQKQTEAQFHSTPLEYVPYVPIKRRKAVADSDAPWRRLHWGAISEENLNLLVRYQEPPSPDIIHDWMEQTDDKKDPCVPSLFCYITRGNCRVFVTRKDTRCNTLQTMLPSTRAEAERWMLEVMRANPEGRYATQVRSHGKAMMMVTGMDYITAGREGERDESMGMFVQKGSLILEWVK
ncbi:hypothetical protein LTR56_015495 [Elasticomyces elasticus]|nr:hypothetical protein LTR56_015495 [Elasticomyces elasticus]KAK3662528.1 hypothetical protein LTR22_006594 [Elasticomyces elasticus]KAK4927872.1 hypothetical protein LTR49_005294 [Elasticomyces elasticus]KAK5750219.1 hypothetical protein LTS12_019708 [Elasticomyces elasticus]